ncbi:MAG TPA: hypothetical protein VFA77_03935 [Candidatus Eisenbacteria bacterium]|nr:hypothetical protein [Candidatus Eisenbacteria bacterium]
MPRLIRNVLIGFAMIAALLLIAGLVIAFCTPQPKPLPLPSPNGYDELVKAGNLVCDETADHYTMKDEQLRSTVLKNVEALQIARGGFGHESRIPFTSLNSLTNGAHSSDLSRLKRMAHAFVAEGQLGELEHRPQDAAQAYLDAIRLGHEGSRGGVIIDSLVGISIQAIGLMPLEKLQPNLDAKQCRQVASALEEMDSKREPINEVFHTEKAWVRATYGWKATFLQIISFRQLHASNQKYENRMASIQKQTQRLAIACAARAYELEHGEKPKTIEDLAPAYLKTVPKDAATGQNLTLKQ